MSSIMSKVFVLVLESFPGLCFVWTIECYCHPWCSALLWHMLFNTIAITYPPLHFSLAFSLRFSTVIHIVLSKEEPAAQQHILGPTARRAGIKGVCLHTGASSYMTIQGAHKSSHFHFHSLHKYVAAAHHSCHQNPFRGGNNPNNVQINTEEALGIFSVTLIKNIDFQHSENRLELMFILVRPRCFRGVDRAKAAFMGMSHSRSDSSPHSSSS